MAYRKGSSLRLVLSSSNMLGSKLIKFLTWSTWSHVGILCDDDMVIEATWPRVRRVSLDEFLQHKTMSVFIDIPCSDRKAAIAAAEEQLHKPYDVCGLFAFFGFGRRDWMQDDHWFCSELAAYALMKGGMVIFRPGSTNRITPQHFWLINF